jgi:hypothetical protein
MKKVFKRVFLAVLISLTSCGANQNYVLTEKNFFLVMTNMQFYPEQYGSSNIEFDCFMYDLVDVYGVTYQCGVRKCSSGFGCTCGNDTIIGFILHYEEELPQAKNQSEDTNEKTWVHIKGKLSSFNKKTITIHSYLDGEIDYSKNEEIQLLEFDVSDLSLIEDYANLSYYLTK